MSTPSPVSLLADLSATALIGADRAGGVRPAELLSRAAAAGLKARAGFAPPAAITVAACPSVEPWGECSARAASILQQLITQNEWVLAEEWAGLAHSRERRIPPAALPAVLEACVSRPGLARALASTLGECGRWLASLNPAWGRGSAPVEVADMADRWSTGTAAERREWLAVVRRNAPEAAEGLVRSTWTDDSPETRRRFVEVFTTGLAERDEPFLEGCLADRAKQVGNAAAELLPRLASSRFVARMIGRADPLLSLEAGKKSLLKARRSRLTVEPPAEWDPSLAADGVEEKPPSGTGKRAWWLRQVLACVPPAHWSSRFERNPAELIAALEGSDYEKDVLAAWAIAAPRAGDAEWCAALARHAAGGKKVSPADLAPLWQPLDPERREGALSEFLEGHKGPWAVPWAVLVGADHAWSAAFTRRMLAVLSGAVPPKQADWWEVGPAIETIRQRLHIAGIPDFETLITDRLFKGDPPPSITRAIDLLRLRAEMHKELSS